MTEVGVRHRYHNMIMRCDCVDGSPKDDHSTLPYV